MKYRCRDCEFSSGKRSAFVRHLTNHDDVPSDLFNYERDGKISEFCCGTPYSSKFRLQYHIYRDHKDNSQVGFGNNIRRVDENPQPNLQANVNDDMAQFITSNYTYQKNTTEILTKISYTLYTDVNITDGTARDFFVHIINDILSKLEARSFRISIDYCVNFCKYVNLGYGNELQTGEISDRVVPIFILSAIARDLNIESVITDFDHYIRRVYLQGSGWVLNRMQQLNIIYTPV